MSEEYSPLSLLPTLRRALLALVFALLLLSPSTASAQTDATISGRVTNSAGELLQSVAVYLYPYNSGVPINESPILTNEDGDYTMPVPAPGTYRLGFSPHLLSTAEKYHRLMFYPHQTDFQSAANIVITDDEQLTGYDVTLLDAGRLIGSVVDHVGMGIQGIEVQLIYVDSAHGDDVISYIDTDSAGKFSHYLQATEEYYLFFNDKNDLDYVDEYYNNKSARSISDAITLAPGEVLTLTAKLRYTPTISGTVTDNQGNPIRDVIVTARGGNSDIWEYTDKNGNYAITSLEARPYTLIFEKYGRIVPEYYRDQSSSDAAEIIDLTNDIDVFTANAMVTHYGYITGRVTDVNGKPVRDIVVVARYWDDDEWAYYGDDPVYTDENGEYRAVGRPNRENRVEFQNNYSVDRPPYETESYPNAHTIQAGQSITVPLETTIPNIDAVMRLSNEVEADFVATSVTGIVPFIVDFNDNSSGGILSQRWNFGDGTGSIQISPSHTYTTSGTYAVTLTVTGTVNSHTMSRPSYISVVDAPITNLQIEQSNSGSDPENLPTVGKTLYFSATSGGSGIHYLWDFGDDTVVAASTATGQYVQHSYDASGNYTVTLTASNGVSVTVAMRQISIQESQVGISDGLFLPLLSTRGENTTVRVAQVGPHSIRGTVTDIHGAPIKSTTVQLIQKYFDWNNVIAKDVVTDENGNFIFESLYDGEYYLVFLGNRFVGEFYDNQSERSDAHIFVLSGAAKSIVADAVLNRQGIITGTVTDLHGTPLADVTILSYYEQDGEWKGYGSARTDQNGSYKYYAGEPATSYRLRFSHWDYVEEFYGDAATVEAGHTITVPHDSVTQDINAVLRRYDEVEADFSGIPLTGTVPFTTSFYNQSKDLVNSHMWNFGDGTTSTEISPTHAYTMTGIYTVTLTVVGAENRHTKIKKNYISVVDTPITELGIQQSTPGGNPQAQPKVGETIHFSATAAGSNVEYLWDFGDDSVVAASTAAGQYVQHSYDVAGTYTVTLTASNGMDEAVITQQITIQNVTNIENVLHLPSLHVSE